MVWRSRLSAGTGPPGPQPSFTFQNGNEKRKMGVIFSLTMFLLLPRGENHVGGDIGRTMQPRGRGTPPSQLSTLCTQRCHHMGGAPLPWGLLCPWAGSRYPAGGSHSPAGRSHPRLLCFPEAKRRSPGDEGECKLSTQECRSWEMDLLFKAYVSQLMENGAGITVAEARHWWC